MNLGEAINVVSGLIEQEEFHGEQGNAYLTTDQIEALCVLVNKISEADDGAPKSRLDAPRGQK